MFAIKVDDKYGFMNKSGNTVIAPQFDEVGGFAEGLSAVRVGTKWGYVNTKGAIMITPQFDAARPFRYGRAAVKLCCGSWFSSTTNDRFGFIDEDGKYIHSPDFLWVGYLGFGGDLAPVKTAEGAIAFVNRAGEVMLSGKFSSVTDGGFSEGVAPVESTGKWGYVDTAGEWIINPQFEGAQGFSGGLAPVVVGGKTGYINTAGRFIINPQYSWGGEFVDGSAIITQPAGMGLIDREGRAVVEVGKFEVVGTFQDGLARVKAGDGWGFIDSSGALAIGAEFDSADEFQNGLARVTALGKEGYITTAGIFVVNPFPGATVKQEKARLAEEARQAQADADAARAATEARAVEERTRLIAEAPQQVLGQWRWSDQSTTQYLPNGTVQGLSRDGGTFTNSWVINGEVLTVVPIDVNGRPANREEISFRIVELNQSKFTVTNIRTKEDSSATRVP
ncbi:MAG: WG repeat-containing protein [Acidobacteriota bacterium]|nr:WG repeat-containing protein [Acidobacteriota bacterium]